MTTSVWCIIFIAALQDLPGALSLKVKPQAPQRSKQELEIEELLKALKEGFPKPDREAEVIVKKSDHVKVRLYGEATCPDTQDFLRGERLRQTLSEKDGTGSIVDFDFIPFGNAYYGTDACGHGVGGEYDLDQRKCWDRVCGRDADRPKHCFSGKLICQHGDKECTMNRYMACAKAIAPGWKNYMPAITCMANRYNPLNLFSRSSGMYCAVANGLSVQDLSECVNGQQGEDAVKQAAMATPDHEYVPYLEVNDVPMEPDKQDELMTIVCKQNKNTTAELPAGVCVEEAKHRHEV